MSRVENTTPAAAQDGPEPAGTSPEPETLGDELQEVGSGRSPATPAWLLLSVVIAVAALFAVAIALVTLAYVLS